MRQAHEREQEGTPGRARPPQPRPRPSPRRRSPWSRSSPLLPSPGRLRRRRPVVRRGRGRLFPLRRACLHHRPGKSDMKYMVRSATAAGRTNGNGHGMGGETDC